MIRPATDRQSQHPANLRARRLWLKEADAAIDAAEDAGQTGEITIRLKLCGGILKTFYVVPELEHRVTNDD